MTPTTDTHEAGLGALPTQEEQLAVYIASYPAHQQDLGPENTVFGDHVPSDGAGLGEVPAPITRLAHDLLNDGYCRHFLARTPDTSPQARGEGWRPIEEAPKDGTPVLLWCVHPHARWATDAREWSSAVVGQWIDHNGGGWTWHGMAGRMTHFMPLPAPPVESES